MSVLAPAMQQAETPLAPESVRPPVARQSIIGNQALLRRLHAKLTIGAVDDPLEHEADAVAEQVMRMPEPRISLPSPVRISRKCSSCEQDNKLQAKCDTCADEEQLQTKRAGADMDGDEAPASVDAALASSSAPLDPGLRNFFEPRFGADFSGVRIHHDAQATGSARDVGARAYTVGNNIVFGSGQYAPGGPMGRSLIAHELAHVVQQGGGPIVRRLGDPSKIPQVLSCPAATSNGPQTDQFLLFPNMGSDLTAAQKKQVADFVDNWKSLGKGATVRVDGFASKPGEDALNWQLSCDRAGNVKNELVTPSAGMPPGIPDGSINMFMHGETDEFGDEAQNRRVSLFLPGSPAPDQPNPAPAQNQPNPPDSDAVPDASCAKNPACPDDYCKPFATKTAARADRDANAASVLADIGLANRNATPLFRNFIFAPGPGGDISKTYAADFTSAQPTIETTKTLVKKLEDAVKASPPAFPPGSNSVTLDINSVLGMNAITQLVESTMVYTDPLTVPGLIAGGVGKTQVSCKVGQNTDGAVNDSRSASGTVLVTKNADGSLQVTPNINYTLIDTLDFCPGNCGGWLAQHDTIPLSRWEASGIAGDIPFTVKFPAPSLIGAHDSEE